MKGKNTSDVPSDVMKGGNAFNILENTILNSRKFKFNKKYILGPKNNFIRIYSIKYVYACLPICVCV